MQLRASATGMLLLAVFVVALAYGVQLPLMPSLLERQVGSAAAVSWHTGALAGVYTLALFLFAPAWGYISDRWQRRGVILIGLAGFAVALAIFAFIDRLAALYVGRFLSGAFSAAIVPASLALIADVSPDEAWRARRFAWINIAGIAGFLVGPAIGGGLGNMWTSAMPPSGAPFLAIAAASAAVAAVAWRLLPLTRSDIKRKLRRDEHGGNRRQLHLLLAASSLLALGLGTFEVGLALIGTQELQLPPAEVGSMFTECMVVMAAAQVLVFNPWFPPRATRWLMAPAFGLLAGGLLLLSTANAGAQLYWAVAAIAGAAGILSPVIGFWVSLSAGKTQGRDLGWQTSASSIGQAVGSAMAGLLYGTAQLMEGAFLLAAGGALAGAAVSLSLAFRLARSNSRTVLEAPAGK
jgi:MFS family permease